MQRERMQAVGRVDLSLELAASGGILQMLNTDWRRVRYRWAGLNEAALITVQYKYSSSLLPTNGAQRSPHNIGKASLCLFTSFNNRVSEGKLPVR
jgi:hypothetical protein